MLFCFLFSSQLSYPDKVTFMFKPTDVCLFIYHTDPDTVHGTETSNTRQSQQKFLPSNIGFCQLKAGGGAFLGMFLVLI